MRPLEIALLLILWLPGAAASGAQEHGKAALGHSADESTVRCALDVGSGSIKLKVARVVSAVQVNQQVLFSGTERVAFQAAVGANGKLSDSAIEAGAKAIKTLIAQAQKQLGPAVPFGICRGVATSVFRTAKNGSAALKALAHSSGTELQVIDQSREAALGFYSALAVSRVPAAGSAVWDIGGGSMQLSALRPDVPADHPDRLQVFKSTELASEPLKQYVLRQIQHRSAKSPNPLSPADIDAATAYVREKAKAVPEDLRQRIASGGLKIIGIGGVLGKSVLEQCGKREGDSISVDDISRALAERTGWADDRFRSKYADTQLTNLILVKAFMQQNGIREVFPFSADLTDGVLASPQYWPRPSGR